MWKSTIVDPCFWSPDFPARYVLTGTAGDVGGASVASRMEIGVRQWGVRAGRFWLNGHRWVWRAAECALEAPTGGGGPDSLEPGPWQEALLSQLLDGREVSSEMRSQESLDRRIATASTHGIALAVRLEGPADLARLAEWAHVPALLLAILPAAAPLTRAQVRAAAPNLLFLAEFTTAGEDASSPASSAAASAVESFWPAGRPDWCDGVIGPADPAWLADFRIRFPDLPLVARRDLPVAGGAEPWSSGATDAERVLALRRACERLQAELLPVGDLEGYVVARRG